MPDPGPEVRATHVVLIGLMGSGKTTVGKKVAKLIGHRFVDADVELEARTGRSVASWFEDGEPAFRAAEAELLEELLADPEPLVLGAGGGVVVTEANRRRLQEHDVTAVYLHGTPEFLASRVQAKAHRPLLADDPLLFNFPVSLQFLPQEHGVPQLVVSSDQEHRFAAINQGIPHDMFQPPFRLTKVKILP